MLGRRLTGRMEKERPIVRNPETLHSTRWTDSAVIRIMMSRR
jgi:hypothetical protein